MDERLTAAYVDQLEKWITHWKTKTQLPQHALGHYAKHFDFGESYQFIELPDYTVSRTLKNRPLARADGKYNLYCILGILYREGVIQSLEEVRQFLETYHINAPNGKTWQDIRYAIEAGVERGQPAIRASVPVARFRVRHLAWVIGVIVFCSGIYVRRSWLMRRSQTVLLIPAASSVLPKRRLPIGKLSNEWQLCDTKIG